MSAEANTYSGKRIAMNAVLLYARTFVVLCVSLYVSRLVLSALGAENLGIYNVVGGIVTLMSFFQAALTKSTGRYITYDLGATRSTEQQSDTFSACLGIHILIVIALILFGETIGLWILANYTIIPEERLFAAKVIYQLALFSFSVQILCVPYSAAIIAHEKMSTLAIISIFEAVLKLVGVVLIVNLNGDMLILYGLVIGMTALIIFATYVIYVISTMPTYRCIPVWKNETSLNILSFAGWTILGSATNTGTQQGVALLFNNFVSLIANAALGFANQVNAALSQFVNSFTTAFTPQVIKLCAGNEYASLHNLMTFASKISFVLAYIIALPLITNMEYILELWLENVPLYTKEFCQLILVCTVIDATTGVYNTAITATGKIQNYQIAISISFTLDLLFAYILLVNEVHPALVFGSRILTRGILNMGIGLYYTKHLIAFDVKEYFKNALIPILLVLTFTVPVNLILTHYVESTKLLFTSLILDTILIAGFSYLVILSKSERLTLQKMIKQKAHAK